MSEELPGLPNTEKIVDENIVYSSNSLEQHIALVKKFLTRCREAVFAYSAINLSLLNQKLLSLA